MTIFIKLSALEHGMFYHYNAAAFLKLNNLIGLLDNIAFFKCYFWPVIDNAQN